MCKVSNERHCDRSDPWSTGQEKLLTSRRSSPTPNSSLHSGRPPRRSAAGPGLHFDRWRRRHPACGSPEESDPPFPGSPSLRRCRQSLTGTGFTSYLSLCTLATLAFRGRFGLLPSCASLVCQITSAGTLSSTEHHRGRMILYFPRTAPCSSQHSPLGGDTGLLSTAKMRWNQGITNFPESNLLFPNAEGWKYINQFAMKLLEHTLECAVLFSPRFYIMLAPWTGTGTVFIIQQAYGISTLSVLSSPTTNVWSTKHLNIKYLLR